MLSRILHDRNHARLMGALYCACSRALREAAPHVYFPGWEKESEGAIQEHVVLAAWFTARTRAFEPGRGQTVHPSILGLFALLSAHGHEHLSEFVGSLFAELFENKMHPETNALADLASLANEDLRQHTARLLEGFDDEVRRFVQQEVPDAYVRELYVAMNGVEVYMDAWYAWNAMVRKRELAAV